MGKKNVTLYWDNDFNSTVVFLGKDGTAQVEVPPETKSFVMMPGPKAGKEPNRVAYFNCNGHNVIHINVAEALKKGTVPQNECGSKNTVPRPGEVVFWALPLPWLLPDLQ